jgi:hypothetical protein
MLCIVDIDCTDQKRAAELLCQLFEICCEGAQQDIRKNGVPDLYRSGVRFAKQPPEACAFKKPSMVLKAGGGDCKQLVLWRMGDLLNAGVKVTPRIIWIPAPQGFMAHAQLRHNDGRIEDPSLNLGMRPL